MKLLKTILTILILLPSLSFGQTTNNPKVNSLLDYINTEFGKYNKFDAHFGVEGNFLVFSNQFGVARIPFKNLDFRVDEKSSSIDVYCISGEKCINKYDDNGVLSTWDYYNVSLIDGSTMAGSIYTILDKCKQLKSIMTGNVTNDSDDANALLTYINKQFSKYNKYGSQFDVDKYAKALIFKNEFGTANIPFSEIGFRINEEHVSIDIYCLDGSACINKYDDSGELTTWDYYNVSMPDGDGMASEIYTVLEKCKKLRTYFVDNDNVDEDVPVEDNSNIDELLTYINSEIKKYNKYGARISVDRENLVFMNDYGRANIPFSSIDFRMNDEHHSIDIYCLNGSKCIEKYDNSDNLTTWDYYNISLPDGDGMAQSATQVLQKCKTLKQKALR
jgi:hypothetical protein